MKRLNLLLFSLLIFFGIPFSVQAQETTEQCQTFDFPAGWSMFSTYIEVEEPWVGDFLSDLISESNLIIVKRYTGGAYLVEWLFADGVGNIAQDEAYQIKLQEAQTIEVCGQAVLPETTPVNIPSGWYFIPYLRTEPSNAVAVLADIADQIIIVKDDSGMAYIPNWNYNGIGDLEPGKGYQIKMASEQTLLYLSNDEEY